MNRLYIASNDKIWSSKKKFTSNNDLGNIVSCLYKNYRVHLLCRKSNKKFKGKFNKNDCKNANFIMNNGLYLPSGNNIKKKEINFICEQIKLLSSK